nr:MAG TPA: pentapeptide repeat protein [Caudoviricetes sp.]
MMDDKRLNSLVVTHGRWRQSHGKRLVDLSGAKLQYASLCDLALGRADLHCAVLRMANLERSNLCGANMRMADLRHASLRGARLRGADLRCADLSMADLRGVDLRGAKLVGANLCGALLPEGIVQIGPLWFGGYLIYWVERDGIQCNGWNRGKCGALVEFERAVERDCPHHDEDMVRRREEYRAAIAMCRALRQVRLGYA